MKPHLFIVSWALIHISTSAMAIGPKQVFPKAGTTLFQYTAETATRARTQGVVAAGGLKWTCVNNRCTISGPWPTPAVAACQSLAAAVGAMRSYGHPGLQLNAAQLAQCNAGLAVAAPVFKPAGVAATPPPAVTVKNPSLPTPPAPGPISGGGQAGAPYQLASKPGEVAFGDGQAGARLPGGGVAGKTLPNTRGPGMNAGALSAIKLASINSRKSDFGALKRAVASAAAAAAEAQRRFLAERERSATRGNDCDDSRADVHPGATEICDHADNNCNGEVDEGQTLPRYLDADGDGHGDPAQRLNVCPSDISRYASAAEAGSGPWLVEVGNDIDDANPDCWNAATHCAQ